MQSGTRPAVYSQLKAVYNPEGRHPARYLAGSGFRPLTNIPHCCLPKEFGPCLSSNVGDLPLRTPTHRRLGGPLPRQQANGTHRHLIPKKSLPKTPCGICGTSGINLTFARLFPGMRQVRYALLTRAPVAGGECKHPPRCPSTCMC